MAQGPVYPCLASAGDVMWSRHEPPLVKPTRSAAHICAIIDGLISEPHIFLTTCNHLWPDQFTAQIPDRWPGTAKYKEARMT